MTTDISKALQAKSDQLNADDLIGREMHVKITGVNYDEDRKQQKLWIYYDQDPEQKKPWKPCKSMLRILAYIWTTDAEKYVGRELLLYRDESVKYAGEEVGGIRVKAASHISSAQTIRVALTKHSKKAHYIDKLETKPSVEERAETAKSMAIQEIRRFDSLEDLYNWSEENDALLQKMERLFPKKMEEINSEYQHKKGELDAQ